MITDVSYYQSNRFLGTLWNCDPARVMRSACQLYAPLPGRPSASPELTTRTLERFLEHLHVRQSTRPKLLTIRFQAAAQAAADVIEELCAVRSSPSLDQQIAIALRPVYRMHTEKLAESICLCYYTMANGPWAINLTRPQSFSMKNSLGGALCSMPPACLLPFWRHLQDGTALWQHSLGMGLRALGQAHAVNHLLFGLQHCQNHTLRITLVLTLEQIGEPAAMDTLHRLERDVASTDWPLARQIARALQVIEHQNRGNSALSLLRPAAVQYDENEMLRLPAADNDLLRIVLPEKPSSKENL